MFENILYVESIKDYIKIITADETHIVKHSLKSFEESLDKRFLRIHRSYIVNTEKISAYTKQDVEIEKMEIPIGESFKDTVFAYLEK